MPNDSGPLRRPALKAIRWGFRVLLGWLWKTK